MKWLADQRLAEIPLFVSRNSIGTRKQLPDLITEFALDSGGFTELQRHGRWTLSEDSYITFVQGLRRFYGKKLVWVAPQDWMCEPIVLKGGKAGGGVVFAGTGLTVEEHQRRTVDNFVRLRARLGFIVVPVLQGWKITDYWRCQEMYSDAGVDLASEAVVAVGSVCRRQNTEEAAAIMETLARDNLRLHGFGFKKQGVVRCAGSLTSADSMAWSLAGRLRPNLEHDHIRLSKEASSKGKPGAADDCSGCMDFMLDWYKELRNEVEQSLKPKAVCDRG